MPSGFRHTLESAIELARSRHGDEYDYSRVKFKKITDKVLVLHKICGKWSEIQLSGHINSGARRCPHCYIKRLKTTEQFIQECLKFDKENHYDFSGVVNYRGNKQKVNILCCKCQTKFDVTPLNFLHGSGCPKCYGTPNKGTDGFVFEAVQLHGI